MEKTEDKKMSLTEHLIELRKRIVRSFIILGVGFGFCYYYKDWIFDIITRPLIQALPKNSYLIYTGLTEAFFVYMKLAFFASLIITCPLILYQIWKFISPGLLLNGKKICRAFCFIVDNSFYQRSLFRLFYRSAACI